MKNIENTILLNSGHSEVDPGGDVVPNNIYEYESQINLAIRDALVPELLNNGFEVKIVPDNLDLRGSYNWVNSKTTGGINGGLAFSIHCNRGGGQGAESYYHSHYESSKKIAKALIDKYCEITGLKNRGAKSDSTARFGELSWIRKTDIWASLIECGFLDSSKDMDFIIYNIDIVAEALCRGICAIYGHYYKEMPEELKPELGPEPKKDFDKEAFKKKIVDYIQSL